MIRNIIFDMGGVIIRFDREYFIRRLGVEGEDVKILMNEVFRSLEWARMDRGSITEEEAAQNIFKRTPERLHDAVRKLVFMWERPILPVEGMYELIAQLKDQGYGIYLLSNASVRQHEYWLQVPASEFFDGKLISADVQLVKPEAEIYQLLCSRFGLIPSECVMIDDTPQNIEGAYHSGMLGLIFNGDTAVLRDSLKELGVTLP